MLVRLNRSIAKPLEAATHKSGRKPECPVAISPHPERLGHLQIPKPFHTSSCPPKRNLVPRVQCGNLIASHLALLSGQKRDTLGAAADWPGQMNDEGISCPGFSVNRWISARRRTGQTFQTGWRAWGNKMHYKWGTSIRVRSVGLHEARGKLKCLQTACSSNPSLIVTWRYGFLSVFGVKGELLQLGFDLLRGKAVGLFELLSQLPLVAPDPIQVRIRQFRPFFFRQCSEVWPVLLNLFPMHNQLLLRQHSPLLGTWKFGVLAVSGYHASRFHRDSVSTFP